MTPEQLAAKGTESGEQKALFAWAAMACYKGFVWADDMGCYQTHPAVNYPTAPVAELKWMHAIPNGGKRDAVTASRMKAEGVRVGIPDVMLPVARHGCHGLYIELKTATKGRASKEQSEFGAFALAQGYHWQICNGWREAAALVKKYLT